MMPPLNHSFQNTENPAEEEEDSLRGRGDGDQETKALYSNINKIRMNSRLRKLVQCLHRSVELNS